ncbi:bacteriocin-processing peptidase. Cysteine peptidase. MEROPS family C39 [Algoriphagus faecimaris]|uniref:Bacteriocin-processing peptidase. Cysteine peptidase. MEROPS family C39 n=1 Tax=Algoriphagus faecimaris TaxID=686796 RepID=A0A1G6MUA3_9BACT|nr:peptidase domain-containing ABC transporter [Algoriphagus faecimaris]SDC59011.1 bacteriocin-processing peptidase. Cysteine peptidase. MEROPS family C39 [Algoriphagus faecimaris]
MNIKIKQRDITDCGAACLASVAAFYKLELPVAKIRQMASTDQKGTNILGLIEAATKMGFSAKGVRGEFDALLDVPMPVIAHVIVKKVLHHYVVLYKVTDKQVEYMDPGDGQIHRVTPEAFKEMWTGVLVLLMPNEEFQALNQKVGTWSRFWFLVRPHSSVMIQSLLGAVVYTILGLSTSIYVQKIIDHVFIGRNTNLLNLLSVAMIVLLVFQLFIGTFKTLFIIKVGQRIDARLILGYYKHLLSLPQRFFDTMRVGEIISRINDAVKIRAFINDVSISFLVNVFIIIFSFALMFTFYWKLALVMLLLIPLYAVIYWISNRLNKKVERRLMEESAELESQLVESITSASTIKRFGAEDHANIKTEMRFVALLRTVYRSGLNSVFSGTSSEAVSRLFTIILLWVGAGYVLQNEITPGELMSFYALTGYLTGPISSLIGMNKTIQNALIAADRLFEIMDLEVEKSEETFPIKKSDVGDISFLEVSFRYGSRANVFEGLSLTFPKGKISGVIGESGSGKSTLVSLLQNLYPLQSGNIYIGEHDIKFVDNTSLRRIVSVVPQRIDLFAGNVLENIALGNYQPDMQRVVHICHRLGMMDFVESLPNGFGTYLGENGAALSGGQKQRIAIARALYRDPEILILDEATASLDPDSEQFVQQAIRMLATEGKTIIFITHRLAAVQEFDRLYVLDKGKLVEEGNQAELIAREGKYFQMIRKQLVLL